MMRNIGSLTSPWRNSPDSRNDDRLILYPRKKTFGSDFLKRFTVIEKPFEYGLFLRVQRFFRPSKMNKLGLNGCELNTLLLQGRQKSLLTKF